MDTRDNKTWGLSPQADWQVMRNTLLSVALQPRESRVGSGYQGREERSGDFSDLLLVGTALWKGGFGEEEKVPSQGCRHFAMTLVLLMGCATDDVFVEPNMDFGSLQTVAVLPFQNLTNEEYAAARVRDSFSSGPRMAPKRMPFLWR